MNPSGVVLIIAGVWVISQVALGDALTRLGIIKPADGNNGDYVEEQKSGLDGGKTGGDPGATGGGGGGGSW